MIKTDVLILVLISFMIGLLFGICITIIIVKIVEKIADRRYKREEERKIVGEKEKGGRKEAKKQNLEVVRKPSEKEKMLEMLETIPIYKKEKVSQKYNDDIYGIGSWKGENKGWNKKEEENIIEEIGKLLYKEEGKREQSMSKLDLIPISFTPNSLYKSRFLEFEVSKETKINAKFLLYKEKYLFLNWNLYNSKEKINRTEIEYLEKCYQFINESERNIDIDNLRADIVVVGASPATVVKKEGHYILKERGFIQIKEVY